MGRPTWHRASGEVTCIACGASVSRDEAREYDKHGDRWDREGKSFEYLCKPCDRERCHSPRRGLEATLVAADAGATDTATFLRRYCSLARADGLADGRADKR